MTNDLFRLPPVSLDNIYEYFLVIYSSLGSEPKGVLKHKVNGYQLFKEGFVNKIRIKDNFMCEKNQYSEVLSVSINEKHTLNLCSLVSGFR